MYFTRKDMQDKYSEEQSSVLFIIWDFTQHATQVGMVCGNFHRREGLHTSATVRTIFRLEHSIQVLL